MKKIHDTSSACAGSHRLFSLKRPGIHSRLMLYFAIFVVFILLLLWFFQIAFLDQFYKAYKTRQVKQAAEVLMQNFDLDSENLTSLAAHLSEQHDVCILLLDQDLHTVMSTEVSRNCLIHHMSEKSLLWWCEQAPDDGSVMTQMFRMNTFTVNPEEIMIGQEAFPMDDSLPRIEDFPSVTPAVQEAFPAPSSTEAGKKKENKFRYRFQGAMIDLEENDTTIQSLVYLRKVTMPDASQGYLFLNTQINPVSATTTALREQLAVISVLIVLFAILLSTIISRRISQPIIRTNEAARELSHARFEKPKEYKQYREIEELNHTLEKAATDLGQVETLQHELIANVSHDLRTPLTMIGGYAEAMRDIPDENTPENMQIIIDETARLSTLVNELLDFSRLQSGSQPLVFAPFCLTDSVRSIILRIGKLVEKDGYTIEFTPDQSYFVNADENRIGRVVYNLIGNALTYTGPDHKVTVSQSHDQGMVRLEIHDSGKGIAKDELELIWNRYYRTKETHKRAIIGSGLGLNIVRSILEQHQVPFGVESEEGQGTTFWFALPEVAPPEPS